VPSNKYDVRAAPPVTRAQLTLEQRPRRPAEPSANRGRERAACDARVETTIAILSMARVKRARIRAQKAKHAPLKRERHTAASKTVAALVGTATFLAGRGQPVSIRR